MLDMSEIVGVGLATSLGGEPRSTPISTIAVASLIHGVQVYYEL
jgi:hypothetical protein